MPLEVIVPSLRIQTKYRMNESDSEQRRVERLLELEEDRIRSMSALKHEQQLRKVFVDRCRLVTHTRDENQQTKLITRFS
jgi:hypothetical protein